MQIFSNKAATFFGTKEASLYFDEIFPLMSSLELSAENLEKHDRNTLLKILNNILPKSVVENQKEYQEYFKYATLSRVIIDDFASNKEPSEDMRTIIQYTADGWGKYVKKHWGKTFNVISDLNYVENMQKDSDVCLTILNLNLIDVSRTSFQKIIELRKDVDSMSKLRRLRLFVQENYQGKSKSFVEDDLLLRIYEYEQQVKTWQFETKEVALSTLLSSKTALGAAGGSLLAVLSGAPIAAAAAASLGVIFELGKIGLAVSQKKFKARALLGENPVSYLAKAKGELVDGRER